MNWLRTRIRAWLGITSWEEQTLDEQRRVAQLADESYNESRHNTNRHGRLRREVEELGILATTMRDALGPIWTTAQGHSAPMALLSTSHLRNILDGGFARSERVREFAEGELQRRENDQDWRLREAMGQRAPTREEMAARVVAEADAAAASYRQRNSPTGRTITGRIPSEPEPQFVEIDYAQLEARTLVNMLRQALYEKNVAQRRTSTLEQELEDIIETGG